MQIINRKGKICVKFQVAETSHVAPLYLAYTESNLAYVREVLLPIFTKFSTSNLPTSAQKQPNLLATKLNKSQIITKDTKPKRPNFSLQLADSPRLLSDYCALVLTRLSHTAKPTTLHTARSLLARFFDFIPDRPIAGYNAGDIELAILAMQRASLRPATIRALLAYVNLAFHTALRHGKISQNPISLAIKPRLTTRRTTCFDAQQVRALLAAATGELRDFLHIAFYTGCRSGEILALTREDFDFKKTKFLSHATSLATLSLLLKAANIAASTYRPPCASIF